MFDFCKQAVRVLARSKHRVLFVKNVKSEKPPQKNAFVTTPIIIISKPSINMGGIVSRSKGSASEGATGSTSGTTPHHASPAVKESWELVKKHGAEHVGMEVFVKLFDKYPAIFQMFKSFRDEPNWQETKGFKFHSKTVVNVIGSAVVNVQSEEALRDTIHSVGTAHSFFDIRDEHFSFIKVELMHSLEALLKEKFTAEVRSAWSTAYDNVMNAMVYAMQHSSTKMTPKEHHP